MSLRFLRSVSDVCVLTFCAVLQPWIQRGLTWVFINCFLFSPTRGWLWLAKVKVWLWLVFRVRSVDYAQFLYIILSQRLLHLWSVRMPVCARACLRHPKCVMFNKIHQRASVETLKFYLWIARTHTKWSVKCYVLYHKCEVGLHRCDKTQTKIHDRTHRFMQCNFTFTINSEIDSTQPFTVRTCLSWQ